MAIIGTDLMHAAKLLKQAKLVAIPTETVYGLAAKGLDANAVAKVFIAKNRPHFDPLILHIGNKKEVNDIAKADTPIIQKLIDSFWPGPLTLVLPKKETVPDIVTSGLNTVAVRMPNHKLTLELLNIVKFPLAAPSANPFGYTSPVTTSHVNKQLGNKIDYIIEGGRCKIGLESTILKPTEQGVHILRHGAITAEMIMELGIPILDKKNEIILAPGMLKSHYSPIGNVILFENTTKIPHINNKETRYIVWNKSIDKIDNNNQYILSSHSDLSEAAHHLFNALRQYSEPKIKTIYAQKVPDIGIGKAINDRLERAAN